ncbi:MAG TPA: tRNA pseudouridine(38-40) synthase TruA, partial [Chitinophagaceae bacterium]
YFPYPLNVESLYRAAEAVTEYEDFTSFSKRNTQVKNFKCTILRCCWIDQGGSLVFEVSANRFLRGMVRALVGTMLRVGRGKLGLDAFREIIEARDCSKADFAAPAIGLFLMSVNFPEAYFEVQGNHAGVR